MYEGVERGCAWRVLRSLRLAELVIVLRQYQVNLIGEVQVNLIGEVYVRI
jgi:hypothetical protein